LPVRILRLARVSTAPRGAALRSELIFQKCSPKTAAGTGPATYWLLRCLRAFKTPLGPVGLLRQSAGNSSTDANRRMFVFRRLPIQDDPNPRRARCPWSAEENTRDVRQARNRGEEELRNCEAGGRIVANERRAFSKPPADRGGRRWQERLRRRSDFRRKASQGFLDARWRRFGLGGLPAGLLRDSEGAIDACTHCRGLRTGFRWYRPRGRVRRLAGRSRFLPVGKNWATEINEGAKRGAIPRVASRAVTLAGHTLGRRWDGA
jgi:hypothetical protein